jgi:hypothetical protein
MGLAAMKNQCLFSDRAEDRIERHTGEASGKRKGDDGLDRHIDGDVKRSS